MRILILGAGALGGLVGAQLTRAGEDVTLLEANRARARLLGDDGLLISRIGEAEACVPLCVVSSVDGLAPFGLVFVAVKSYETADAVRGALPACNDADPLPLAAERRRQCRSDRDPRRSGADPVRHHVPQHPAHRAATAAIPHRHQAHPDRALRRRGHPGAGGHRRDVPPGRPQHRGRAQRGARDLAEAAAQRGGESHFGAHGTHLPRDDGRSGPHGVHALAVH